MSNFDDAFDILLSIEGDYSNNPADPGGETRYGVTKRVAVANGYTGKMIDLPLMVAKGIAKKCYWDIALCDQMPFPVAYQVFDTVYNGGSAIKWLQQSCGIKADGIIGANTISAVRESEPIKVVAKYNLLRLANYISLTEWPTFGKGWTNRIARNLTVGTSNHA